ncbi:hypothetical protein MMC11_007577 [Xylographa trunciseda]|nr:hypothetical protein [Xylographa trunciseda]
MPEFAYCSDALYDYRQPYSTAKSSRSYPKVKHLWIDWCFGLCRPAASADDKAILGDPALKPVREPHGISPAEAIKLVQQCLKSLTSSVQDRKYVGPIAPTDKLTYPFEIFDHIDKALFSGVLKGNVFLKWEFLQKGLHGRTSRAAFAASPRISIGLSDNLRRGSPSLILEALVHQMLHAYLLQCCGYKEPNTETNGHDLTHSLEYSTIAYLIQKYLSGQEHTIYPVGLGPLDSRPPVRRRSTMKRLIGPCVTPPGGINCEAKPTESALKSIWDYNQLVKMTTPVPSLKIQDRCPVDSNKTPRPLSQYFHSFSQHTGKAVPQLRTTYKTSEKYIEFHFQDRAFPIPLPHGTAPPSLSDRIKSSSVFKVPGNDEDTFKRLISFVEAGDYKPSGSERQPDTSLLGPPAIVEYNASSKAFLLVDIKVYRLGLDLDFKELKALALRYLSDQYQSDEDPCAVLEYIYHGGPTKEAQEEAKKVMVKHPDTALRDWVKAWLKVPCGPPFFDNLGILQKHPLWVEKYSKLRERGSELVTDIDSVEKELVQKRANRFRTHAAQKLMSRSFDSIPQAYQYLHRGIGPDVAHDRDAYPLDSSASYDLSPNQIYGYSRSQDGFDPVQHPSGPFWNPFSGPPMDAATNFFLPNQIERPY